MRKILSVLTAIIVLFTLTACASTKTVTNKMYIQKAELTKEEQSLIDLIGLEKVPYIVDFSIDNTVQSLQINTYELQNNEWKMISGGGGQQLNETHGRIALTFDNIGLGIRTAVENYGSNSYETETDFSFEGMSIVNSYLINQTPVEYEKEIPLVIQIHTSKNGISSLAPEYGFYEPQTYGNLRYEKVYAITCLFSQKMVNELSALSEK